MRRPSLPPTTPYLAILIFTASGCSDLPKRGSSDARLSLGDASVFQRERFVSDRYDDLGWLRKQLEKDDYEQGLQGSSSVVFRRSVGFAASAVFNEVAGVQLQDDTEEDAGGAGPPASGGGTTPAAGAGAGTGTTATSKTQPVDPANPGTTDDDESGPDPTKVKLAELRGAQSLTPLEAGNEILKRATEMAPQVSPRDRLRDRLAFRDEVRSAIRQRALDDTHDLKSSTIYDLQFDLSLLPGSNSGSAYAIVVEIDSVSAKTAPMADRIKNAAVREVSTAAFLAGARARFGMMTTRNGVRNAKSVRLGTLAAYVHVASVIDREVVRLLARRKLFVDAARDAVTAMERKVDQILLNRANDALTRYDTHDASVALEKFREAGDVGTYRSATANGSGSLLQTFTQAVTPWDRATTRTIRDKDKKAWNTEDFLDSMFREGEDFRAEARSVQSVRIKALDLAQVLADSHSALDELASLLKMMVENDESSGAVLTPKILSEVEQFIKGHRACPCPEAPAPRDYSMNLMPQGFKVSSFAGPVPMASVSMDESAVSAIPMGQPSGAPSVPTPSPIGMGHDHGAHSHSDLPKWFEVMGQMDVAIAAPFVGRVAEVLCARDQASVLENLVTVTPVRNAGTNAGIGGLPVVRPVQGSLVEKALMCLVPDVSRSARVVGISPEEQAERLSTTAQAQLKQAIDLAVSGQADANTAVSGRFQRLQEELRRYDLIKRNPLILGFIEGGPESVTSDKAEATHAFGWVVSPPLETSTQGAANLRYRQVPRHHPVGIQIVTHAAATELVLRVKTYEIRDGGAWRPMANGRLGRRNTASNHFEEHVIHVSLPGDAEALVKGLLFKSDESSAEPNLAPRTWTVRAGQPASLVVQGANIWRSPEVYLGGQRADTVRILPDLKGLSVSFKKVAALADPMAGPVDLDLLVSTSQGSDTLSRSVSVLPPEAKAPTVRSKGRLATKVEVVEIKKGAAKVDLAFILEPPMTKGPSGLRLRVRRPGSLGAMVDKELSPGAVTLTTKAGAKQSLMTVRGVELTGLNAAESLECDLFTLAALGAEPARLTPTSQGFGVLSKSLTYSAAEAPPEIGFRQLEGSGPYVVASDVEFTSETIPPTDADVLGALSGDLLKPDGASVTMRLGKDVLAGQRLLIRKKEDGTFELYLKIPRDLRVPSIESKDGKVTTAELMLELRVGAVEIALGKLRVAGS